MMSVKQSNATMLVSAVMLLLAMVIPVSVRCETPENVQSLLDDLLSSETVPYNRMIRGEVDLTRAVTVEMGLSLISIDNLDEVRETLDLLAVMYIAWTDRRLTWRPDEYNNTIEIQVDHDKIWMPMIALGNPSTDIKAADRSDTFVWVDHTGRATWRTASIFKVKCPADFSSFPFDRQSCGLLFHAWGYTSKQVRLVGMSEKIVTTSFTKNGLWKLYDTHIRTIQSPTIQHLEFVLELERHAGFYILNICVPAMLLGILSIFGLLIPYESGERISYSITVLLSIAVFLNFIQDILPANSVKMPSICYFIVSQLGASFVACLCSVLSLKMYHSDSLKPPRWLTKLVCRRRNTPNQIRNNNNVNSSSCAFSVSKGLQEECFPRDTRVDTDSDNDIVLKSETKCREDKDVGFENGTNKAETADDVTWRDVCYLFDKISLVVLPAFLMLAISMYSYHVMKGR